MQHEGSTRALGNVALGSVPNPSGFGEHASGEIYPTGSDMDLRRTMPIAQTRTVGVAPNGGALRITDAQRMRAGNKAQSLVWERMRRLDRNRMPPIASHVVDDAGLALIGQWIDVGAN